MGVTHTGRPEKVREMLGRQKGSAKAAQAIIEPVNDGLDKKGPSIHFAVSL